MLFKQFLNRFSPLLLGYDIFISYRRTDAGDYAEKLAIALQEQGFICFLDREETVAGIKLSPALNRALRRSHTLVVILTPGVLKSDWVEQEVETFLRKPNRLVPINVDKFLFREDVNSTIFAQLRALSGLDESKESLQSGNQIGYSLPRIVLRS